MAELLFKLEYTIREMTVARPEDALTFEYGGPHGVRVVISAPSPEEQAEGHKATNAFCTASCSRGPNDRVYATFMQIAANEIPKPDVGEASVEYDAPNGLRIHIPGMPKFPEPFRSFAATVNHELKGSAVRTVSALRWRANELGPHNPISTRGLHWSLDGDFWHPMPTDWEVRLSIQSPFRPSEQVRGDVFGIVASGSDAPFHHDLFREAWEERHANPRSAIVIGMAAAEISVKHCISTLIPEAKWLAIHAPTPDLIKMLKEYLPGLPTHCKIDGQVKPPPDNILESLRKGVKIRNDVAHAGASGPSGETVERILEAVHDLLWLIDFYCGAEWALGYLRPETSAALSVSPT